MACQIKAGDKVFNGELVVVSVSEDCRVYRVRVPLLDDPGTDFELIFDSNQTEADIVAILKPS